MEKLIFKKLHKYAVDKLFFHLYKNLWQNFLNKFSGNIFLFVI